MAWGKCDDGFYDHPKVRAMTPSIRNAACGLFWRGISLCNRILSDGRLSQADVEALDGTDAEVAELVRVRLWQRAGKGLKVHDFLDFNDSKAVILARREVRSAAGRQGGLASGAARSKREASASTIVERFRSSGGSTPNRPGREMDGSTKGGVGGNGEDDADHLDAWYRLTASWPSPKVVPWLNQLADGHGSVAVCQALAVEWMADPDRATVLGRTRDRLEREAHEARKAAEVRSRQEAEEERARIEAMPEEQRRENLDRLAGMMAESGLLRSKGRPA